MISTAIGSERRSRVSGYRIKKGFFNETSSFLPQQILVIGVPNTANAVGVDYTKIKEVVSANEAGVLFGFGSPIHQAMKILRPIDSDGVGGIPTFVLPLENNGTAKVITLAVTGTATAGTTHYLVINGRNYAFNINTGDTAEVVAGKIADLNNATTSSAFTAVATDEDIVFTAKFNGLVSQDSDIFISNEGVGAGLTYAVTQTTAGSGQSDLTPLPAALGENWITGILNTEGVGNFAALEQINGIPYSESPNGRYNPIVFKPFMAFTGFVSDDLQDYNDLAENNTYGQVTNVICPAPGSGGTPAEAAANVLRLFARRMQDTPELDVNAMAYPDMPESNSETFEMFTDYNVRDNLMKKGISTVTYENGQFIIQDLVTTYKFDDEDPLQFNYARNLNLDWNVKDAYYILEKRELRDKVIILDDQITTSTNAIKVKEWKSVLGTLFDTLASQALIYDVDFSKSTLQVERDSVNKNRINTNFRYRRTAIARIVSTDAEGNF